MGSSITVSRIIDAPPSTVFAHATNVENWAEIVPAIDQVEMLTPGPVQVGTRFRETRTLMGRQATEEMEFLELDVPNKYVLGAQSHGCRYRTEFVLTPEGGGTKLTMVFHAEALTFMAKVMTVLMKPFMKKLADVCGKDLDAIKAHIEASAD